MTTKKTVYAVLTVAPNMEYLRHGEFIQKSFMDCATARKLRDKFQSMGLVVYLEIRKTETTDITGTDDVLAYWGGME